MGRPLKIEVVSTGNELLDGSISDTNTKCLAEVLRPMGLRVDRAVVVSDDEGDISKALTEAVIRSEVIVVSGGLGPTSDDLTLDVAAKVFGSRMVEDRRAKQNVLNRLKRLKRKSINSGNRKQFFIPEGSTALANPEGTAPAVHWKVGDRDLFFLPGVPREYQKVLDRHLRPWFQKRSGRGGTHLFILKVFGVPESELNELMKKMKIPPEMTIGYRTHLPENHIKLNIRAASEIAARKIAKPLLVNLKKLLGSAAFSDSGETFAESVLKDLLRQKVKIAIAESCTGGLVSSMLTNVSGASNAFERGFVTYSNESKISLLGVNPTSLLKYGAVSEQVAKEMVLGAMKKAQVDKAVAITGIAGPTGGTPKKPVGSIWIAAASKKEKIKTRFLKLSFDRELNQKFSAYFALEMLRDI